MSSRCGFSLQVTRDIQDANAQRDALPRQLELGFTMRALEDVGRWHGRIIWTPTITLRLYDSTEQRYPFERYLV